MEYIISLNENFQSLLLTFNRSLYEFIIIRFSCSKACLIFHQIFQQRLRRIPRERYQVTITNLSYLFTLLFSFSNFPRLGTICWPRVRVQNRKHAIGRGKKERRGGGKWTQRLFPLANISAPSPRVLLNPRVFIRMIIIATPLGTFSRIIAVLAADDK